jgi:DNA mismatch endonuclease (patch repair protein)
MVDGSGLSPTGRPIPKSATVSQQMSRMPRSSSEPELRLRRALHAAGLRFTVNRRDLPGTPDVVFSRAKLAVFVDGCFWHGCPDHGTMPKNNAEWWRAKFQGTMDRDRRKDEGLAAAGWLPIHFWEHEALDVMVEDVIRLWRSRTGRP